MNKTRLEQFVALYTNRILISPETEQRNHVLYVLATIGMTPGAVPLKGGKRDRWIGFIQGFCWCNKLYAIDEMRGHIAVLKVKGEPPKCRHKVVTFGPRIPLVHGSSTTQTCLDCGAWRTTAHTFGPWQPGPVSIRGEEES